MEMQTVQINNFDIKLPVGLPQGLDTKVRDGYQDFLRTSTNDVRRHLTCLATLLPKYARKLKPNSRVLHAFGGLGASAQMLDQCVPGLVHTFWERDPVCLTYLKNNYERVWEVEDTFKTFPTHRLEPYDAILLDMSVGTIKTPGVKGMWSNVARWMRKDEDDKFVWFTDTACHKIHLNYTTYAKDFGAEVEKSAESYLNAYSRWLEIVHGLTVVEAMREAGEFYCVVQSSDKPRFTSVPYV